MRRIAASRCWAPAALPTARSLAMQLRQRKLAGPCLSGKQGSPPVDATAPAKGPRRGLLSSAAAAAAAAGGGTPPGAGAPSSAAEPAVPVAGTTAADLPAGTAAQDEALVVPTPEAAGGGSSAGKRKRGRLPPVDIGIPALLLGQGGEVADAAAAADAVDALPLGRAGFTRRTLAAARDYLLKADPSEPAQCRSGRLGLHEAQQTGCGDENGQCAVHGTC